MYLNTFDPFPDLVCFTPECVVAALGHGGAASPTAEVACKTCDQNIQAGSISTIPNLTGIRISGPGWGTGPGGNGGGLHNHCCRCSNLPQSHNQSWTDTGLKCRGLAFAGDHNVTHPLPGRRAGQKSTAAGSNHPGYWTFLVENIEAMSQKQAFTSSSQYPPDFTAQLLFPHSRFPAH